jgi:hypothetical protein
MESFSPKLMNRENLFSNKNQAQETTNKKK